jgi:hypothetical protein
LVASQLCRDIGAARGSNAAEREAGRNDSLQKS